MKQVAVAKHENPGIEALPTIAATMEKARQGIAVVTVCAECGYVSGVPSPRCPRCGSRLVRAREEVAVGRVVSHSILYVTGKTFAMFKPYAYLLVDLESGARVSGWMLAEEIDSLEIGKRVKAVAHEGQALLFSMKEVG